MKERGRERVRCYLRCWGANGDAFVQPFLADDEISIIPLPPLPFILVLVVPLVTGNTFACFILVLDDDDDDEGRGTDK
jgi:hypothetical protein